MSRLRHTEHIYRFFLGAVSMKKLRIFASVGDWWPNGFYSENKITYVTNLLSSVFVVANVTVKKLVWQKLDFCHVYNTLDQVREK